MSQKFKITHFSLATLPPAVKSLQVENLSRRTVQVSSDLRRLILKLSFRPSTTSPHAPCPGLTFNHRLPTLAMRRSTTQYQSHLC